MKLPSDEDFENVVFGRLSELEHLFLRVPFTADVALRALDRVDLKQPPSAAGQQYKDSAIWEHCLDLAADFEVHLVTADKAFYQQNNYQKGLDERLLAELSDRGLKVAIHASIEPLLIRVSESVSSSFDAALAADAVQRATLPTVRSSVESDDWVLGDRKSARFDAFVTERTNMLFLKFELQYAIGSGTNPKLTSTAVVEGQGMYQPAVREVTEVQLSTIRKYLITDSGTVERKHRFAHLNAVIGGLPPVPYEVREPLPGGSEFRSIETEDEGTGTDSVEGGHSA